MINLRNQGIDRKKIFLLIIGILAAVFVGIWVMESSILVPSLSEENNQIPQMMYRMNPQHTGVYDNISGGIRPNGMIKWSFFEPGIVSFYEPVVQDNVVYIRGDDKIFALDPSTGQKIWETQLAFGSLAIAGDQIYTTAYQISDDQVSLYALFAENGSIKWHVILGKGEGSDITIADGKIFVGTGIYGESGNKGVWELDAASGNLIGQFKTDFDVASAPAVADNTVYVGSGGWCYAFGENNGSLLWKYQTDYGSIDTPVVHDGHVYVVGSSVFSLDAATGQMQWKFTPPETELGMVLTPAATDDLLYVGSKGNILYALNTRDGSVKWLYNATSGLSSPSVADGVVYVNSWDGQLYALDGKSGFLDWNLTIGNNLFGSSVIANGTVYVIGEPNGSVRPQYGLYAIK